MQLMNEIPDTFWSLFRSVNRDIYIEALLCINEEYEYNNYFLTKEVCIQILSDMNAKKRFELQREENDTDFDMLETPSSRILNWLLRAGWLKRIEDYNTLVTNIVIPDYAAVMIDAFEKLNSEDASETDIYIQNVYATLYAFRNDPRASIGLLRTALVNTRRLNKALQDMLHNMNKFFAKLLQQDSYSGILREHLDSYVEDVLDLLDLIERGFDDIEHRIANMDKEHTKYVRATVTRMNYLLSGETDTKGLVVQLLNKMSEDPNQMEEIITETGKRMNLSLLEILSEKSLYKRKSRKDFISQLLPDETTGDLDKDDILRLNRIQMRFSKKQIEEFIESNMEDEVMDASKINIADEEEFEKLILAYDYSTRKNSKYKVLEEEPEMVENAGYRYPALRFVKRRA